MMKRLLTSAMLAVVVCGMAPAWAGLREPAAKEGEYELARLAMRNKFYPAAVEALREIVARYPRDPRAWTELWRALAAQGDRESAKVAAEQAAELYRERVQIFPEDGAGYVGLMRATFGTGRYEEAKAVLEEGLRRNPTNAVLLAEKQKQTQVQSRTVETLIRDFWPSGDLKLELVGKSPKEVQAVLEAHGIIAIGARTQAVYLEKKNRLIVAGTKESLEAVEQVLENLPK